MPSRTATREHAQRHQHTVVGLFHSAEEARAAMRRLDHAGLPPFHVGLVAGDPELAADVGARSFALWGALCGFALGLALVALFVALYPEMRINLVGIAIGGAFMSGGLGFIGLVCGRAIVLRTPRSHVYERVVEEGGGIVTVACVPEECERARDVLSGAGADAIVDEGSAEPV